MDNGTVNNYSPKKSKVLVVVSIFLGLFLFIALIFAGWAFMSRQDYKNNVDSKISDASAVAVQKAESSKETEFLEREKLPIRTYRGSATYGSLSFEYPKTWSIYTEEAASGVVLDLFAFPGVVPGVSNDSVYALRTEITSSSYDSELKKYDRDITSGAVKSTAFRPSQVSDVLGVRLDGAIDRDVQGSMVMFPLRDRTIKIYTQIPEFTADFDNIILPSIKFVP